MSIVVLVEGFDRGLSTGIDVYAAQMITPATSSGMKVRPPST